MGKSKSKSFVYSGHAAGLAVQYLELKGMFIEAQKKHRELIVVQSKDESSGEMSYNLCDVFDLPGRVSCVKHMKIKCDNEKSSKKAAKAQSLEETEKADKKKKVVFHCDPPLLLDSSERIASRVDLIPVLYDWRLSGQRTEEVDYIESVLGYTAKDSKLLQPYTVIYWEQASTVVGRCKQNSAEADCAAFKQAVQALLLTTAPHCAPAPTTIDSASLPRCYIAGATHATAKEAGYLLDQGLLSFRGAWLQHHKNPTTGVYDESALMPVNAVSMEVMEWGVMMGAEKFYAVVVDSLTSLVPGSNDSNTDPEAKKRTIAGEVILLTSLVEHERAKDGKTYCLSHKAGANDLKTLPDTLKTADISWCGSLKTHNYVYTPKNSATDDGPFENPTLNRFVVNLALYLLNVFSSRPLQLLLGGLCVVSILGVSRLCFLRWRRATNKTF